MIFFVILLVLICLLLGLVILVQNPKGGGLAGNVAGFSNQFMGVKQTTDVLEKGTWILAVALVVMCILSNMFIPKPASPRTRAPQQNAAPAAGQPALPAGTNP